MPQCTSATFSRVERAGPSERHARPDRRPPSIGQRTGTNATSRRRHDGVRCAPEQIRSGRSGAGLGWGGAGTLPRVAEGEVREDLPDDRGIVQRGDQAEAAATLGTRQHVDAERPVHQGRPAPSARTGGLHFRTVRSCASGAVELGLLHPMLWAALRKTLIVRDRLLDRMALWPVRSKQE
jgi:hypothetical protein